VLRRGGTGLGICLESREGWFLPVILALRRLRQKGCEFKASLGYIVNSCLKGKWKKAL
jgi:hypothetical protein